MRKLVLNGKLALSFYISVYMQNKCLFFSQHKQWILSRISFENNMLTGYTFDTQWKWQSNYLKNILYGTCVGEAEGSWSDRLDSRWVRVCFMRWSG